MTETPLSAKDQAELDSLPSTEAEPSERTLLDVWDKVLDSVEAVSNQPIQIPVAAKVVASWPQLSYQDTAIYHKVYHSILGGRRDELKALLTEHPEASGWLGQEDAEHNHEHYRDILVTWHNALDQLEEDWRAEDPESHIWAAAIADARAFFFSRMGFAGHLDTIGFELSDGEFVAAVQRSREAEGE